MNYLTPEKNLKFLKYYHSSSKLLLPFGLLSYSLHKKNYKKYSKYIDIFNIFNFTYHSYVSTSCVITDYVKIKYLEKPIRIANSGGHILASLGFLNLVYKHNKNLLI